MTTYIYIYAHTYTYAYKARLSAGLDVGGVRTNRELGHLVRVGVRVGVRVRARARVKVRHLETLPRPLGLHQLTALIILVVPHAAHLVRGGKQVTGRSTGKELRPSSYPAL